MAACGSLEHIFKKPPPENPALLMKSLSWNQMKPTKPNEKDSSSSFTEILGGFHFKENPEEVPYPPSSTTKNGRTSPAHNYPSPDNYLSTNIFSSMNSESLQLCTEGLGFESSADVEELRSDPKTDARCCREEKGEGEVVVGIGNGESGVTVVKGELKSGGGGGGDFPPPISCIGESGKPWVWFKSYRQNGRFVLKEIRVPNQEFLHASREDGRLKLQFYQADGEEEDDYEDDYDESTDGNIDGDEEGEEEMMGR